MNVYIAVPYGELTSPVCKYGNIICAFPISTQIFVSLCFGHIITNREWTSDNWKIAYDLEKHIYHKIVSMPR